MMHGLTNLKFLKMVILFSEVSQAYSVSDCMYIEGNMAQALLYNLHTTLFFVDECFTEQRVI
jgi:hypothetical protein